jgi:uncharacterized protein (TIGR04255 family)
MFDLPAAPRYRLNNAPLAQALVQVRFPIQARLGTLDGIATLQERLNDRYPYLQPSPQATANLEVQFGVGGAQAAISPNQQEYVFASDDGHSVWVSPSSVGLVATSEYQGVDDFSGRFEEILIALHEVVAVPRCDRIAARYLTVAPTPPGDTAAWTRWFRHELTGWPASHLVPDATRVVTALNQVQLTNPAQDGYATFPAEVQEVLRHGLVPGGSGVSGFPPIQLELESFVLDFDFFCEAPQVWNPQHLHQQFLALHAQIDSFFRWTLTDEALRDFGYEEVAP